MALDHGIQCLIQLFQSFHSRYICHIFTEIQIFCVIHGHLIAMKGDQHRNTLSQTKRLFFGRKSQATTCGCSDRSRPKSPNDEEGCPCPSCPPWMARKSGNGNTWSGSTDSAKHLRRNQLTSPLQECWTVVHQKCWPYRPLSDLRGKVTNRVSQRLATP